MGQARFDLIGVPFDGYGRSGAQSTAPAVLREAGLLSALGARADDGGDVALPAFDAGRGATTTLINEPALLALASGLRSRVSASVRAGRMPVLVGGDCSLLFDIVPGAQDALGPIGLVFVDGHEDTMPLDVSEDGEAANCEIGLLLGITGRSGPHPLRTDPPALSVDRLAVIGPRDEDWRRRFNVGSLSGLGVWLTPVADVSETTGSAAARHVGGDSRPWWLHVDLDVLDPEVFRSQGLPDVPDEPGGLTWQLLRDVLVAAVSNGGCVGLSLVIYDPDQDHDRTDVRNIVELIADVASAF